MEMQIRGISGTIAEVKGASQIPAVSDPAQVVSHRPDDPLLTALVADTFITGQGGQSALGNNILLNPAGTGWIDCTNFRSIALQIVASAGISAGAVIFEGSNDGTNPVAMALYDKATPQNAPINTYTLAAGTSRFFIGNILFKYFRVRISTAVVGGTVQAFSELMGTDVTFIIQAVRMTDGTNVMPTMDTASRRGYQALTDGTNTAAVKAASTPPAATDPAAVVTLSPNLPVPTVHTLESAATTNATSVKASAGRITSLLLTNTNAAARFFKLFQKASAPVVGTDIPVITIPIPANSNVVLPLSDLGAYLGTGIAYAITGAIGNLDTTVIGAGDVKVFMNYI